MEADRGNTAESGDGLSNIPMKRKRGRPRKHPRLDPHRSAAPVRNHQNLNLRENIPGPPPGYVRSNGNQTQQAAPTNGTTSATDNMVGMHISGLVEASFDAGYLVRVTVGNTGTTMRGVVFKPGHYSPVMPGNDVAPGVEMIQRHEVRLPVENHSSLHDHKPHSTDASPAVNHVSSGSRQATAPTVNHVVPRCNVMPVVLEPCKAPNGATLTSASTPVAPKPATILTSKQEECVLAAPSNECSIPNDQAMHDVKMNENSLTDQQSIEELPKQEAKQMSPPANVQYEPAESHQPLVVEAPQSEDPKDHPAPTSQPMEEDVRSDKMSELLQVVQETMSERVKDETEKLFGDGQNEYSSKPSQTS